jgi:hypothetical protein
MYSGKTSPIIIVLIIFFLLSIIPPVQAVEPTWTYTSPGSEIGGVSVSSDGSAIAVGAGKIWLFSRQGMLLAKEPYGDQVVITPDGSSLVASYSSLLYQFKINTSQKGPVSPLQKLWETSLPTTVRSIDISDNGNTIVASVQGSGTSFYSSTGKIIGSSKDYNALIRTSSTGGRIVGVSTGVLCLYSRTGRCSKAEDGVVGAEPDFMELTRDGSIAVFNDDQSVRSVRMTNKTLRWTSRATSDITSLAITPSGSVIIIGTENGNVDLFDMYGNRSWTYASNDGNSPGAAIRCIAISDKGTVAAAGSYDGKIFAINSQGKEIWSNQTKDHINHIAMSADGTLVIATGDETVYAFSQTAQSLPVVQTTAKSSTPSSSNTVTTRPADNSTQSPGTRETTTRSITAFPTEYSVIRTATQSPVSPLISLLGILGGAFVLLKQR